MTTGSKPIEGELLPCPFCGDRMESDAFGFDHPKNDNCIIGYGSWLHDYRDEWNTRASMEQSNG